MNIRFLIVFVLLLPLKVFSQLTGHINYEKLGVEFDIPAGWVGQEGDGMVILRSNSVPGIVIMTTHNYSRDQLIREAKKGIQDQNGTALQLVGQLANLSSNALGGTFTGTMEWQPAKTYIIGLANPYTDNPGLSIMAATTASQYDEQYEDICLQIFKSVKLKNIDRSKELTEWKDYLSNKQLIYMDSHYSSGYTDGGVSGGYSSERRIHLCSQGYFNYGSSSDLSVSGDGVSGYGYGNDKGSGSWKLVIGASGNPTLVLNFNNGEEYTYELAYSDNKLFLNGTRYFVGSEGEYAPDCR